MLHLILKLQISQRKFVAMFIEDKYFSVKLEVRRVCTFGENLCESQSLNSTETYPSLTSNEIFFAVKIGEKRVADRAGVFFFNLIYFWDKRWNFFLLSFYSRLTPLSLTGTIFFSGRVSSRKMVFSSAVRVSRVLRMLIIHLLGYTGGREGERPGTSEGSENTPGDTRRDPSAKK